MKKPILLTLLILTAAFTVHSQPPVYKVYAVRFARSAYHFSVADWADGGPKTDSVKIDFMFWLIKAELGRLFLI